MDDPALDQAIAAARPAARARDAVLASVRRRLFRDECEPDVVDRYVIERKLGAGGMGVVWAARDPRLGRMVALKLLHGDGGASHRSRLLREARALARLTHPNVVEIYDVGAHGDRVYIAMELIEGRTLSSWLASEVRPWREVVAVFVAAGRGLQAAHAVDLVHRDFKPQNVMVSDGGARVRVMDFGLAQRLPSSTDAHEVPMIESRHGGASRLAEPITGAGQRVGTPAYMAPEQHDGGDVDARTDQFGFCAALYEGLLRVAPFRAPSLSLLAEDKRAGRLTTPPLDHRVPNALLAVVRRGLAADPAARHPSMAALLAELQRVARVGRGRRIALGAVVAVGLVSVAASIGGPPACEDAGAIAASMWPQPSREEVESAFDRVENGWAADARARTLGALDRHAADWSASVVRACETFAVGDADRERAHDCLQRDRQRFAALVEGFATADSDVLHHAVEASLALPDPQTCIDEQALAGIAPPPTHPELAARVELARERLAQIWMLDTLGRLDAAQVIAAGLLDEAVTREHPPLRAEVELALGGVLMETSDHAAAETSLSRAYFTALDCDEHRIAAQAATMLVFLVGQYGARHGDAFAWARHAEAALAHVPDDIALHAELAVDVGLVHAARGEVGLAQARYREAMTLLAGRSGTEGALASATQYLGISYLDEGRYLEARETLARVVDTRERIYGSNHRLVASARVNLANALSRSGDLEGALAEHRAALAILESVSGPEHPEVGVERNNLGSVLDALGQLERAHEEHARALAVFESAFGTDHPYTGATLVNLGRLDVRLGRLEHAEVELERARTVLERILGADHPHVAYALLGLGELEVARARPERALAVLDQASRGCPGAEPLLCAEIRFASAQALGAAGDDAAARRAASDARDDAGAGPTGAELRARIDAWSAGR